MKAIILKGKGDVSQLVMEEVPIPNIKSDEILIRTKAFSINPLEYKIRRGNVFTPKLLQDPPSILGWDASGVIEKVGQSVKDYQKGDEVYGIMGFPKFGKTYAEFTVAKSEHIVFKPKNISFEEAAVSNIAALTAYQTLHYHTELKPGKSILIHAASGGVGHFAVQMAKQMGAEVYATASGKNKSFVKELGADHFIDYKTQDFEKEIAPVDYVLDLIGGNYIDRSLNVLKRGGTIISIPSATNEGVEEKAKNKNCKGVRFIMQTHKNDMEKIAGLLASEEIKAVVSKTYNLSQIREAHQELEDGHTRAKMAIKI